MKFTLVPGKNFKNYVKISEILTTEDFEIHEIIKTTLYRSEYNKFKGGFNKTISYSYLIDDIWFPVQFWDDVQKAVNQITKEPIYLENQDYIYDQDIEWDEFVEWVESLKLPDYIDVHSEKYLFQRESVYEAILNKCVKVEIGTSGGKTFITYLYTRYLKLFRFPNEKDKILVIVPTKDLVKQLQKDFGEYQEKEEKKLIIETIYSGASVYLGSDIVCGTFHSLREFDIEYFKDFKVVICDEVHGAKSYSIKNEIYSKTLNSEYFFGMSGTIPEYKTLDYLHIVSLFGKTVYKKETWELIELGVSTPVDIEIIKINYIEESNFSENLIGQGIIGSEKYLLEKKFFHSYEKRTKIIGKLLKAFKGNVLILVESVEYCQILKTYLENFVNSEGHLREFEIIHGKISDRETIYDEMRSSDNYTIIATYGTMATGISIKNIDYLYLPDGGKSFIRVRQGIGRLLRLFVGKERVTVFDIYDNLKRSSFKNHALTRQKTYKQQKFPFKIREISI